MVKVLWDYVYMFFLIKLHVYLVALLCIPHFLVSLYLLHPFKLALVLFWQVPIILWALLTGTRRSKIVVFFPFSSVLESILEPVMLQDTLVLLSGEWYRQTKIMTIGMSTAPRSSQLGEDMHLYTYVCMYVHTLHILYLKTMSHSHRYSQV